MNHARSSSPHLLWLSCWLLSLLPAQSQTVDSPVTVTDTNSLAGAISDYSTSSLSDFYISLSNDITLDSVLPLIDVGTGTNDRNLHILGNSHRLLSNTTDTRHFFIQTGGLHLSHLNLEGGNATGGAGGAGGGGGGLGAGGSIFVNSQGRLNTNNVNFFQNTAVGGDGGDGFAPDGNGGVNQAGGGGGGMGGNGGSFVDPTDDAGGGGGGLNVTFPASFTGGDPNNSVDGGFHVDENGGMGGGQFGGDGGASAIAITDSGDDGGFGGGGGGAGGGTVITNEANGGNGGFGGGGGGGNNNQGAIGGDGGFGGGGGAGGGGSGNGGFGAGGAGRPNNNGSAGTGGFGAGDGTAFDPHGFDDGSGGGGAGLGGAIFVNEGASISLTDTEFHSNSVTGGINPASDQPESALGSGLFRRENVTFDYTVSAGKTVTIEETFDSTDQSSDSVTGTFTKKGDGALIFTDVLNAGEITVEAGTLGLANSKDLTLTLETGSTLLLDGDPSIENISIKSVTAKSGTTVSGNGAIADLTFEAGPSVLSPGTSPGTIVVDNLVLTSDTTIEFELGALTDANDKLDIATSVNLVGTIEISILDGFQVGSYLLIDAEKGTVTENSIVLGSLPNGIEAELDFEPARKLLHLNVTAIPEPSSISLLGLAALALACRRRQAR